MGMKNLDTYKHIQSILTTKKCVKSMHVRNAFDYVSEDRWWKAHNVNNGQFPSAFMENMLERFFLFLFYPLLNAIEELQFDTF